MAANQREARRRRILERGSDRLALITGQIQSLPSSSASPPPYDQNTDSSSQPLISNLQDLRPPPNSDQPTVSHDKDKTVGSSLPHNDPQISVRSSTYDGTSTAPLMGKSNEIESAVASTPEDSGRAPPCFSPSEGQDAPLSTFARDQHSKPKLPLVSSFSINELSLAISESEKTRLCFSTIIAFLVVASCVKFPFLGQSVMRFLFGFRPLYLVLLTNATIVLGRLLFTKQKGFRVSDRRDSQVNPPEGQSSVEQIGKVLEASLVAQKAMGAILMDCSVFAVIVVSGLSLLQRL
uniref:Transmembrane protein n=1 Tax=Cucumis melo TaxID=3656 RepID=A0A9I9D032_CUCME